MTGHCEVEYHSGFYIKVDWRYCCDWSKSQDYNTNLMFKNFSLTVFPCEQGLDVASADCLTTPPHFF